MARIVVLEVEDIKKRTLFKFHKKLLKNIKSPKVLVFLWTTDNEKKLIEYKKIIKDYFNDLGAEVIFFNDDFYEFNESNVIYLPGGNTELLLKKFNENPEVVKRITEFDGVIIGNSAGAIALAKEGYGHKANHLVKYFGLGIVNIKILVHFNLEENISNISDNTILLEEGDNIKIFVS